MKSTKEPVRRPATAGKRTGARTSTQPTTTPASRLIDQHIHHLGGWHAETLARVRALILEAVPGVTEEWKWDIPVWSQDGILCTGEAYKKVVKLTFAQGAKLPDPGRLFNSSLGGNTRRAIDIPEGATLDARAFKALVKAATAHNGAKADGDAPVQAYLAAMPDWKRELGEQLDAIIARSVPGVTKAVKWNSPFYGVDGKGWFLSFHVLTRYVKVTFFAGTSLRPIPPGGTPKSKDARWIDIHEDDALDEAQMSKWVKQAAKLPGWVTGGR